MEPRQEEPRSMQQEQEQAARSLAQVPASREASWARAAFPVLARVAARRFAQTIGRS
jgi:hypothetical protein